MQSGLIMALEVCWDLFRWNPMLKFTPMEKKRCVYSPIWKVFFYSYNKMTSNHELASKTTQVGVNCQISVWLGSYANKSKIWWAYFWYLIIIFMHLVKPITTFCNHFESTYGDHCLSPNFCLLAFCTTQDDYLHLIIMLMDHFFYFL